jgi:photosystem II stability/assembly factor-like uncharacterized protein
MKNRVTISIFVLAYSTLTAQVNFSLSNTGVTTNFVAQAICTVSPSDTYVVGAVYSSGWTPQIYKSTDNGSNWNNLSVTGINTVQILYNAMCFTGNKMILAVQDNAAANTGIYTSTNGNTWSSSNSGIPLNFVGYDLLSVSPSEIYLVGAAYNAGWTPKIYTSTDDGANWTNTPVTGIANSQVIYNAICIAGTKLFLATQDNTSSNTGLYSSLDGINWTASNNGLPANFVIQDLLAVSATELHAVGALYNAGWTPKIYKSMDSGATWNSVTVTGINPSQILYNAICQSGNKVLLATQDNLAGTTGIYSYTTAVVTTGIDNYSDGVFSCFPNPANDIITVEVPTDVELVSMTNISGVIVYKHAFGPTPGNTTISIDVSSYAKGLYFLSMQGNKYSKNRKILVE